MKKINKSLILASSFLISSAITIADKSYASEEYKLDINPTTTANMNEEVNEKVDPIKEDKAIIGDTKEDDVISYEASSFDSKLNKYLEKEDPEIKPSYKEEINTDQNTNYKAQNQDQEAQKENEKDELSKEEVIGDTSSELIYYDDTNLDELFNSVDDKSFDSDFSVDNKKADKKEENIKNDTSENKRELEEVNYYSPSGNGVIVQDGDTTRYYEGNKLVKNAQVIVQDKFYNIDKDGKAVNPKSVWAKANNNIYYINENGNVTKGIRDVKENKYYFSNDGVLQRNKKIVTAKAYYEIGNDGVMRAPINQWVSLNDKKYYSDNKGNLLKGVAKVNNESYYFDEHGVLGANKKLITEDRYYIVDKNGIAKNPSNAWFAISGKTYRTDDEGKLQKGARTINNNVYVFGSDGIMVQSKNVISAGKFYQVDEKGLAKLHPNQWVNIDDKKYHTNENGYVQEGIWRIDGEYYYFTQNGLTPNQVVTQQGIVYKVDDKGIARSEANEVKGQKDLDKVMEWMFNARDKGLTYDMGAKRNSATAADCSSAVYRAMIYGGFLEGNAWVGNTETLFQMGQKGTVIYEVGENDLQYGDIFVAGRPGGSAGAAGHTGFILNPNDDTIIHMSYSADGVSVTPRKGYMGDGRGLPVKYFRLVGATSAGTYLNRK